MQPHHSKQDNHPARVMLAEPVLNFAVPARQLAAQACGHRGRIASSHNYRPTPSQMP